MKRFLVVSIVLLAAIALAAPTFAAEFKYGGMFRVRLDSTDNVGDGNDQHEDNNNHIDQRLRFYFTYVSSENLQVVTKYEEDTQWGGETAGRSGGGDIGADATNIEMKNAYVDFALPNTPVRMKAGVQGLTILSWILDDDVSALIAEGNFSPIKVRLGYIAAQNQNVSEYTQHVDDWFGTLDYAQGPFKASLLALWQDARNTDASTISSIFGNNENAEGNYAAGAHFLPHFGDTGVGGNYRVHKLYLEQFEDWNGAAMDDNNLFDLGLTFEYKDPMWSAYLAFVKNFGSFDLKDTDTSGLDTDYNGWMVQANGNYYCGPFTFTIAGFVTSGPDYKDAASNFGDYFRYPAGASQYWAEIMSPGVLDANVGFGSVDRQNRNVGYGSADHPSNLWNIQVGAAWQILDGTKATLNYYYIGSVGDVVAAAKVDDDGDLEVTNTSNSIGHEIDFYLDQQIVDKLSLKLVAAYLVAEDGYSIVRDDDNVYKLGAQLLWAF